ncbi:MAG: hypothetical protein AAF715_23505 [Myxococcota bacterium]
MGQGEGQVAVQVDALEELGYDCVPQGRTLTAQAVCNVLQRATGFDISESCGSCPA